MTKDDRLLMFGIFLLCVSIFISNISCLRYMRGVQEYLYKQEEKEQEAKEPEQTYTCFAEPYFPETEEEIDYDFDYLCRVITTEGGTNRDICFACAQCLYNACEKYEWKYTPVDMLNLYQYTYPSSWISDEAAEACVAIFLDGETYTVVGNATVFYAPQYCSSKYHESQKFIVDINGVRFFEEID